MGDEAQVDERPKDQCRRARPRLGQPSGRPCRSGHRGEQPGIAHRRGQPVSGVEQPEHPHGWHGEAEGVGKMVAVDVRTKAVATDGAIRLIPLASHRHPVEIPEACRLERGMLGRFPILDRPVEAMEAHHERLLRVDAKQESHRQDQNAGRRKRGVDAAAMDRLSRKIGDYGNRGQRQQKPPNSGRRRRRSD